MVDATYIDNNRLQIVKNDEIAFDTSRPSVQLFDDAYRISLTGFQIDFPSPIQFRAYFRAASGGGQTRCELWSTLIWQEWGPDEGNYNENYFPANPGASAPGPTTRNLPQTFLGSVPTGTDYIDVRVKMTRTKTPANFMGIQPPITFFPSGEWVTSPGGSFLTEFYSPFARHFDIVLSGTSVYLRRFQSVTNANTSSAPGGYPQKSLSNAGAQSGWQSNGFAGAGGSSDGTPVASLFPATNYYLAGLIDARGYDNNGTKRPNGTNICSGGFPDYQAIYTGDIIITPGRHL